MRKLFVLESIVKIKRKNYLLQTMEMCVPMPIFNQVGPRKKSAQAVAFALNAILSR